ncbi:ABC transporter substrate-binding protein [Modestobacter lapidis]
MATTAACGGSDGGDASGGGADEMTEMTLGYVPYTGDAPLFLGIEQGIYEEHGIDLTTTPAQAPAAVIASLVNGEQQIGFTTTITLIAAVANGTDVRCVTPVDGRSDPSPDVDYTGLMVTADSPIQSAADLEGKKVGVVGLGSLNHLFVMEEMSDAGADPGAAEFVQIPFPQLQAALEQGRVDAVVATAPFSAQILAAGNRGVAWQERTFIPEGQGTCFAASGEYIEESPEEVQKFIDAHSAALEYAADHVDEALAQLPKFLDMTPEQAAKAETGSIYTPELNIESIQMIQEHMVKHGFLDETLPMESIVYTPADS